MMGSIFMPSPTVPTTKSGKPASRSHIWYLTGQCDVAHTLEALGEATRKNPITPMQPFDKGVLPIQIQAASRALTTHTRALHTSEQLLNQLYL
jgi:hypothetical protein